MDEPGTDTGTTADRAPPDGTDAGAEAGAGPDRALSAPLSRATTDGEWEVFIRETEDEPLRHVGSVTAPSVEAAHEAASRLFDRFARDLWLCPADRVARYATDELAGRTGADAGSLDAGSLDAGSLDAGSLDAATDSDQP